MPEFGLFTTPVFVFDHDEPALCAELTRLVLSRQKQEAGIQASNHGGAWHSPPDLAAGEGDPWQTVTRWCVDATRYTFGQVARSVGRDLEERQFGARVQMWSMVMPQGGYSVVHDHHEAGWSVVFYADAGDDDVAPGGSLNFVDARGVPAISGGVETFPGVFSVQPRTGMLVVFPGWLKHYVHVYKGTRPRVSLSANIRFVSEDQSQG